MYIGIDCMQKGEILRTNKKRQKKVDIKGIEPLTLCMQSTRSTNWAKRPDDY